MIKAKNNHVVIKGNGVELLSQFTMITRDLKKALEEQIPSVIVEELIKKSFELAFKTEEQLKEIEQELLNRYKGGNDNE